MPEGPSAVVGGLKPSKRLSFIQSRLHEDARRARIWAGAWCVGYSVLTVRKIALTPLFSLAG